MSGGNSNDWLTGGYGDDIFRYAGSANPDTITDFTSGEDRIDLTAFHTNFAALTITDLGDDLEIMYHVGKTDAGTIILQDVNNVTASNFIF